jgi:hypothetical protein
MAKTIDKSDILLRDSPCSLCDFDFQAKKRALFTMTHLPFLSRPQIREIIILSSNPAEYAGRTISHTFFFTPIYLTKIRATNGQFSYGLLFHSFLKTYYYLVLLDTERKFIYPVQYFFQKQNCEEWSHLFV